MKTFLQTVSLRWIWVFVLKNLEFDLNQLECNTKIFSLQQFYIRFFFTREWLLSFRFHEFFVSEWFSVRFNHIDNIIFIHSLRFTSSNLARLTMSLLAALSLRNPAKSWAHSFQTLPFILLSFTSFYAASMLWSTLRMMYNDQNFLTTGLLETCKALTICFRLIICLEGGIGDLLVHRLNQWCIGWQ